MHSLSDAEGIAAHILRVSGMDGVDVPNPLLVAVGLGFEVIPHASAGICGTYDMMTRRIYVRSRRESRRAMQVGHEVAHIGQALLRIDPPHCEVFTEQIRLAMTMPAWAMRRVATLYRGDVAAIADAYAHLSVETVAVRLAALKLTATTG